MVEGSVQTVEAVNEESVKDEEDIFPSVLNYNITLKNNLPALCDLLMDRKLRTTLPIPISGLKPKHSTVNIKKSLEFN